MSAVEISSVFTFWVRAVHNDHFFSSNSVAKGLYGGQIFVAKV